MKFFVLASLNCLLFIGSCANERYTVKIEKLKQNIKVKDSSTIVKYAETITIEELKTHVYSFCSEQFTGRATGTKGQRLASNYLREYYRINNIESPMDSTYYQSIPSSYFYNDIQSSENVLAYIKGNEIPEEVIVISGHLDHEGVKDENVYFGADDNGSGTAAILEIAQAFKKASEQGFQPKRSILFLHPTGEEIGLYGSRYYSENPVFPLKNTVANLNLDMIGRVDEAHTDHPNYIYLIGSDRLSTELHYISERINSSFTHLNLDYRFNEKDDPNRFYYRSDHYNFAKHNVPSIFYFNGTHKDYTQPTDTPDKINYNVLQSRSRLVFATAWQLANMNKRIIADKAK